MAIRTITSSPVKNGMLRPGWIILGRAITPTDSDGLSRRIGPPKAAAVPYADFADPQSLNLYTYVRNIPTSKIDADGHDVLGDIIIAGITITGQAIADTASAVGHFLTSAPPPHMPVAGPFLSPTGCGCIPPLGNQNNNNDNKNQNNSQSSNTAEQGRDAQGKFTSKQPGQSQPGATAEKRR
jgi:hypothetical protein